MKNQSINFLKAVACMCVVFIHAKFPATVGHLIAAVSRVAVMFFFMVAGYYSYGEKRDKNSARAVKRIKSTVKLFIVAALLYLIWECFLQCLRSGIQSLSAWLLSVFSIKNLLELILLNKVSVAEPLWFLVALIYCYLLWMAVNKLKCEKAAGIISAILLFCGAAGQIIWKAFDIQYGYDVFRTAWFYGFPVFMLANKLHGYMERVNRDLSSRAMLGGFFAGCALTCAEYFISGGMEFYFGTVISSFCIFIFAVQKPNAMSNKTICFAGERLSMYVYIIHWAVMSIVLKIAATLGIEQSVVFGWSYSLIVFIFSIAGAWILYAFLNKIQGIKNRADKDTVKTV